VPWAMTLVRSRPVGGWTIPWLLSWFVLMSGLRSLRRPWGFVGQDLRSSAVRGLLPSNLVSIRLLRIAFTSPAPRWQLISEWGVYRESRLSPSGLGSVRAGRPRVGGGEGISVGKALHGLTPANLITSIWE